MFSFFKNYTNGKVDLLKVKTLNILWTLIFPPILIGILIFSFISSLFLFTSPIIFTIVVYIIYLQKIGVYRTLKKYNFINHRYDKAYNSLKLEFTLEMIIYCLLIIVFIYLIYDILK
jgi:hypothetical protein